MSRCVMSFTTCSWPTLPVVIVFPAHWATILDFVYILVLCICGQDRGTSEEFDAVSLAKKLIISSG